VDPIDQNAPLPVVAVQQRVSAKLPAEIQTARGAARVPRPPTRRARPTREKILDAAERLFAHRGFHGVSIREITRAAGVDVALANYHFGSKKGLFEAVFVRRAELLNAERMELLEIVLADASGSGPSVEAVIDAFTRPLVHRSARGGPGWKAYFALVAQVNNSPELARVAMTKYYDPVVHKFIDALRSTLPRCDESDLYWSYHFLSGALTLTFAETGRIDNLSGGVCRSTDLDGVHQRLVPFIAAGFRALCARAAQSARAGKRSSKTRRRG